MILMTGTRRIWKKRMRRWKIKVEIWGKVGSFKSGGMKMKFYILKLFLPGNETFTKIIFKNNF